MGTQQIRFGQKTNNIVKFSILDGKSEIHNCGRKFGRNSWFLDAQKTTIWTR